VKLIVQIPCFNEEGSIQETIGDIPREIEGVSEVEILIIDDGSSDKTVEKAIEAGADYVVKHRKNRGLAKTFSTGIEASLMLGADIIVNTDGDNQYQGTCIPDLVKPIVKHEAEVVIGARPIQQIEEFSYFKKVLQRFGSFVVSKLAGMDVQDTTSGFRAYTRKAAMATSVVSSFTYTLETIIQAGRRRTPLVSVPITVNPKTRQSRLFKSSSQYVMKSIAGMVLVSTQVQPLKTFGFIGGVSLFLGTVLGIRFLWILLAHGDDFGGQSGHVQSLILSSILIVVGVMSFLVGLIANQIGANRMLLEDIYANNRAIAFDAKKQDKSIPNLVYSKKVV
jgi:glycosyltransferase involved in cell wall biosynthesis